MKSQLILFLEIFLIFLLGFILCNICAVIFDCVFDGFNSFLNRIADLPYWLYVIFSFLISAVLAVVICRKTK